MGKQMITWQAKLRDALAASPHDSSRMHLPETIDISMEQQPRDTSIGDKRGGIGFQNSISFTQIRVN